jgi:hypothetical protein
MTDFLAQLLNRLPAWCSHLFPTHVVVRAIQLFLRDHPEVRPLLNIQYIDTDIND